MIGAGPEGREADDLPLTESARRLLADARAESDRLRNEYVGTEHVVLGLLRQQMNIGAQVLQQHGLTVQQAAAEVQQRGGGERA
jgi:ATP-dependent Clp protease ATP-binding subunit ClpC